MGGNKLITVSGTGVNGEGALYNSYNDLPGEVLNVTFDGGCYLGRQQPVGFVERFSHQRPVQIDFQLVRQQRLW